MCIDNNISHSLLQDDFIAPSASTKNSPVRRGENVLVSGVDVSQGSDAINLEYYTFQFETGDGELVSELPEWQVTCNEVALSSSAVDALKLLENQLSLMRSLLRRQAQWKIIQESEVPVPVLVKEVRTGGWRRCEVQPGKD